MKLYGQTILVVALSILAVAVALLIAFELTVIGSLSDLEQQYVRQNLDRAGYALSGESDRFSDIARDWAVWDDTYAYLADHSPAYTASNFAPTTLEGLKIDSILIYDLNGTLVSGIGYDHHRNLSGRPSDTLLSRVAGAGHALFDQTSRSGILPGDPPLFVAASPILTSRNEGPARGTLVVTGALDEQKVREISHDLLLPITLTRVDGDQPSVPADSRVITGLTGSPALLVTIPPAGDLSRSGLYSRVFLLISFLLLTLLFMTLASWLLNRILIRPLQEFNQDLLRIGRSGSLSERIRIRRSDEIGDLASSINLMLADLEQAQQERLTSEQRVATLIEIVEEGICLTGPDGQIWFANPALASIYETTPHDLTGRPAGILFSGDPEGPGIPDSLPLPQIRAGMQEIQTRTLTGRDLWVRISTTSYPLDSGKTGLISVVTDITRFRTSERELLLVNKKLALLGSMTRHDIVNQLTTIRGMLGLISRKNTDTNLDLLISSAEDAAEKINKHIEFSKEYQKAGIEEPRWQDVRTIWNLAYAMARRRGLEFTVSGDDYEIYTDQLLQKVFYNIIENSLRHGKNLTRITVTTRRDEGSLVISCEDDGGGIEDAMKDRIFDRGVGTGTGWGLFFAREVLGLTGMTISESGRWGEGVRFEIRAPEGIFRPTPPAPSVDEPV